MLDKNVINPVGGLMHTEKQKQCPVLVSYIRGMQKNFGFINKTLYAGVLAQAEEIHRDIRQHGLFDASTTAQMLRAFYCLEVVNGVLLPTAIRMVGCSSEYEASAPFRSGRTWDGLTEVITYHTAFEEDIRALSVEIALAPMGADALRGSKIDILKFLLSTIIKGATHLRKQLKNGSSLYGPLGTILAECVEAMKEPPHNQLQVAIALTNISEDNGFSPWDK